MNDKQKQIVITQIKQRYKILSCHLSERVKRIWASSEALAIGCGGNAIVCEATGKLKRLNTYKILFLEFTIK